MKKMKNLKNFYKFIKSLIVFIFVGDIVSSEVQKERMSECEKCIYREGKKCGICGCTLNIKTKWTSEKCPENKW